MNDLRYALRTLAKSPGFTVVAVLTLALGIGPNTAIFSLVYGVLLKPLPYPESDRLVGLAETYQGNRSELDVTYDEFRFLADHNPVFQRLAVSTDVGFSVLTGDIAERVTGLRVSQDFFATLGVRPALGRDFLSEEDQMGGASVAILSPGYWMRRFGGDPGVVGRAIALDGRPTVIVGVMPPSFRWLSPVDVWSTMGQVARSIGGGENLHFVGRLKPGVSSICVGIVFGLVPAWQATTADPQVGLKESAGRATTGTGTGRLRGALVVSESALSLILLVGAGLLLRTVANLTRTDAGFDPRRVIVAEIWVTGSRYDSTAAMAAFYDRLRERLESSPGVRSAAVIEAGIPLVRGGDLAVAVDGKYPGPTDYRTGPARHFEASAV